MVSAGFLMSKYYISLLQTVAFGRTIRQQGTLGQEVTSIKLARAAGKARPGPRRLHLPLAASRAPVDVTPSSRAEGRSAPAGLPGRSLPGSRPCGTHARTPRAPRLPDVCAPLFPAVGQRSNDLSVCSPGCACFVELERRGNGNRSSESEDRVPGD